MPVLHLRLDLTEDLYDRVMAMSERRRDRCVIAALRDETRASNQSVTVTAPVNLTPCEPGGTVPDSDTEIIRRPR